MAWVRATATDHMECSQSAYCTQQETLAVTMPRDYMNPGHTLFTKTTVSTIRPVTNGIVPKKKKKKNETTNSRVQRKLQLFISQALGCLRGGISFRPQSLASELRQKQAVPYVAQNVCSRGSDCRGWQNYQFLLYFSVYLPSGPANFKITPAAIPETTELTAQALVLGMSLTIPASMFHERKLCIVWCGLWCCTWIFRWWYSMVTNEWTVVCLPGIFRVWVQSTYDRAHYDTRFCNESVVWRIMFILEGNLQRSTNSALCLVHALQKRIV